MPSLTRILVANCAVNARQQSKDKIKGDVSSAHSGTGDDGDGEVMAAPASSEVAVTEGASSSTVPAGGHPAHLLPQDYMITILSSPSTSTRAKRSSSHPVKKLNVGNHHDTNTKSPYRTRATRAKSEGLGKGKSGTASSTNPYQKYYPISTEMHHQLLQVENNGSALPMITRKGGHHLRKPRFVPAPPSSVLRYKGGYYSVTSSNSTQSRCVCFRYRPGDGRGEKTLSGTTNEATATSTVFYTDYKRARAMNPSAKPVRCPGVLIVNHKTNEYTITIAHECTLESSSTTIET